MSNISSINVEHGIGILTIDSPPVNALGIGVRPALQSGFETLIRDTTVKAIVLTCAGRTFFAGADIAEFGRPYESPTLREVLELIESSGKPIVAAIHGTALGGGLEVALVCHYRVGVPSAKVGLPEVHLGLLPGAGGTQRLPRIVGIKAALEIMVSGRLIGATEAFQLGILDGLAKEGELGRDAVDFAQKIIDSGRVATAVRDRQEEIARTPDETMFAEFRRKNAKLFRGFKAPAAILQAVRYAAELPFDEGMQRELELFRELEASAESQAQRYAFFAERNTSKVPDLSSDLAEIPIANVGVIGAGTMGGGIAMNFLNAGIPVTMLEASREALDRGVGVIRRNYETSAKRGRITKDQVEQRMSLLRPTLEFAQLGHADLIIEAVYEEMNVKKEVFRKLDKIAKPGAILASNTSFLNVNDIASVTSRPDSVIGLHFFSPANVMRLLEVVRGANTSKQIVATSMRLAKKIGKVPVLSGVCHGFIANRMMEQRQKQANAMILEGVSPEEIDRVLTDYGFAMGEFQMMDLVGLDVIGREEKERTVAGDLVKMGRLGQKARGGYYDYDENRTARPSSIVIDLIRDVANSKGVAQRTTPATEEILARLLFSVVNEGARILEEGIALRASDVDMAAILGYNWPTYTGGPMFWADSVGLPKVLAQLEKMEAMYGKECAPSKLLRQLVSERRTFTGA